MSDPDHVGYAGPPHRTLISARRNDKDNPEHPSVRTRVGLSLLSLSALALFASGRSCGQPLLLAAEVDSISISRAADCGRDWQKVLLDRPRECCALLCCAAGSSSRPSHVETLLATLHKTALLQTNICKVFQAFTRFA